MANNSKIVAFRVIKVTCNIDLPGDPISLSCEDSVSIKKPDNQEEKSVLLIIKTKLSSPEAKDFLVELVSEVYIDFDGTITDVRNILSTEWYPIAKERVYATIKALTADMGITPIDLAALQEYTQP